MTVSLIWTQEIVSFRVNLGDLDNGPKQTVLPESISIEKN